MWVEVTQCKDKLYFACWRGRWESSSCGRIVMVELRTYKNVNVGNNVTTLD